VNGITAKLPSSKKSKGRAFQQKLRRDIIEHLHVDENDILSNHMGQSGCDIRLSVTARKIFPFGIEAKKQETTSIWKWLEQCTNNAEKENLKPLLIFSRNRSETYAVIKWEDLIDLIKKYNDAVGK
jgi:hypothetical protein